MKTKLLIPILAIAFFGCSDSEQLSKSRKPNPALVFHQAKREEMSGWTKMQFKGSPIWINPTVEMDANEIASVTLERTPSYEERKKEEERMKAEFEKANPGSTMHISNEYFISLRFTKNGSKKFGDVTSKCIGHHLAIMHNKEILIAPAVHESITSGIAQIPGGDRSKSELEAILEEITAE